jgi:hypothetical protein
MGDGSEGGSSVDNFYIRSRVERLLRIASKSLRCFVNDLFRAISATLADMAG